jgi:hypothetical protein
MANEDFVRFKGINKEYKDDRGGGSLIPSAVLGIVKNNIDPARSGKIEVYLKRLGAADQDNPDNWTTVRYLSPFFGSTPNTSSPDAYGDYVGNPNSYGFWATPPDINTEVICVFLNGDPSQGFYIGSIPPTGLTHMVPAIGASDSIIPNEGEAKSYGGATRLPVSEINNANKKQDNNSLLTNQPRPIHSYQAAIFNKQGLLRDPDRGPISSSSLRESPSRVFGMSTPGRPIYQGGYDDDTIGDAVKDQSIPNKNFQIIGRRGGHSLVLDDGDLIGRDQLIRLRTATGHQILMNDSAQTLFIIHANGQSYIELGKEGTIDMYSTNSVNIRTQGDLNLHADRNININAVKDLNITAENIKLESDKETTQFAGTNFKNYTKSNYTTKVDGAMSLASNGEASIASSSTTYVNGPSAVNLNTGSSSLNPEVVKQITKNKHTDTLYDDDKGFAAAPGKLTSIVSRAPAHAPWADAGKGVDAPSNLSASANFPPAPSASVNSVNNAVPASPTNPTNSTLTTTVPVVQAASPTLDSATTRSLVSSMATNAATGETADAVKQTAGVVEQNGNKLASIGALAMSPTQLATAGYIKPGSDIAVNASIQEGVPIEQAIPTNVWTGKDGIYSLEDFLKNTPTQVSAASTLLAKGEGALKDIGIIKGTESPTQVSGMILSAASKGITPTVDFVKTLSNVSTDITSKLPPGITNALTGSVSNLIAAGQAAAGLADKTLSGLGNIKTDAPSVESVSSGLFSKITSMFKPLAAGKPQNLSQINAVNKAEQEKTNAETPEVSPAQAAEASTLSKGLSAAGSAVKDAFAKALGTNVQTLNQLTSSVTSSVTGVTDKLQSASGLTNLPGGADAVSNVVNTNIPSTLSAIPGVSAISSTISNITNQVNSTVNGISDAVSGLKAKLGSTNSLQSLTSVGLSANDSAKLNSAISSINVPGGPEVKLPVIATDTFDLAGLTAQSKALLGNPKIPGLNFGAFKIPAPLSADKAKEYDEIKAKVAEEEDSMWNLRKLYLDYRAKYGPDATETESALSTYKQSVQKIDSLKEKMAQIAQGISSA